MGKVDRECSKEWLPWSLSEWEEYKVQLSWTKWFVIPTYGFSPICITKDGGILGSNIWGRLEKHNNKGD